MAVQTGNFGAEHGKPEGWLRPMLRLVGIFAAQAAGFALGWLAGRLWRVLRRHPLRICAALFLVVATLMLWPAVEEPAPQPAPAVEANHPWMPVARVGAPYVLNVPDLQKLETAHSARRHRSGAMEDLLAHGVFADATPHLHLAILRHGAGGPGQPASPYLSLTRRAAFAGLSVVRMAQPDAMPTKFGLAETADVVLGQAGHTRACLAFRLVAPEEILGLEGWLCGTPDQPADRAQLSCMIDRLGLLAAGDDRPLRALFAASERRRDPRCDNPVSLQAGRRSSWLDPRGTPPPLRQRGG